jgi:hypothetical protein
MRGKSRDGVGGPPVTPGSHPTTPESGFHPSDPRPLSHPGSPGGTVLAEAGGRGGSQADAGPAEAGGAGRKAGENFEAFSKSVLGLMRLSATRRVASACRADNCSLCRWSSRRGRAISLPCKAAMIWVTPRRRPYNIRTNLGCHFGRFGRPYFGVQAGRRQRRTPGMAYSVGAASEHGTPVARDCQEQSRRVVKGLT